MWNYIFLNIVAPILVGIVLELFSKWLDKKDDD
ncbi:type I toxin-antitoxin system Fst family toxin [Streptococcus orisratti]|nr:type I toxin-antitoxin system Fst family toxin [Streptococcus orisratti]